MRILLASHFFPPARNAGTENYTLGVARALVRRGHDVEVLCAGDWERGAVYWNGVSEDRHEGVHVHRVNLNWTRAGDPNRVLYDSALVSEWLEGWLPARKPDVVHVTSAMTLGLGLLEVPWRQGIPTVLTLMDFWFLCPRTVLMRGDGSLCDGRTTPAECLHCVLQRSAMYRRAVARLGEPLAARLWGAAARTRWTARRRGLRGMALDMRERKDSMRDALSRPAVVLAHSRFVRDAFERAGLSSRVRHLANGHDLAWRQQYGGKTPSATLRVAYTGQITHVKGVHLLVEAFRRADPGDRARLDIWGDPTIEPAYAEHLRALAAGQPGVRLRGRYARGGLAQVFEDIDVLVVPSTWYENAPLVIQEAFATNTPVVATRLGGMAEAVTHGVDGLLFERGNADDLARQLRRLADEPGLLASLAARAPAVKTVEQEVAELEDVYRDIAGGRPAFERSPVGHAPAGETA